MNCRSTQNQLLILEDPDRPSAEVREHLEECESCRQWQERLLQLERHIPCLPVPASRNRDALIRQFLDGSSRPANGTVGVEGGPDIPVWPGAARTGMSVPPGGMSVPPGRPVPPPILSLENARAPLARLIPRYRLYAALAVAAALFLLVFDGLMLLKPDEAATKARKRPGQDPFLASLLDRDLRLAKAQTPRKRLEALVDLADDLQGQTRRLVRGAEVEDLHELARLFEQVVDEGIVRGAVVLPAEQRAAIVPAAADRLTRAGRDAGRLAQEAPDGSAGALRLIAAAAQHGGERLRALMREGMP